MERRAGRRELAAVAIDCIVHCGRLKEFRSESERIGIPAKVGATMKTGRRSLPKRRIRPSQSADFSLVKYRCVLDAGSQG